MALKAKMQLASTNAVLESAEAVDLIHDIVGASGIREEYAFAKHFRDIHVTHLRERTSPRRLSPEQRLAMLPLVESLKSHPVAFACRMMDGESCDYATELAQFFLDAGCQVPEPIKTSVNDLPWYLAITNHGKSDEQIAQLIKRALEAAGIPSHMFWPVRLCSFWDGRHSMANSPKPPTPR